MTQTDARSSSTSTSKPSLPRGVEVEPILADFGAVVRGVDFRDPGSTELLRGAHRGRAPLR
jgi:hypothetical protein